MYLAHFFALLIFSLIFGAVIAWGVLFFYLDVQRTNPWKVRVRSLHAIDAELKEVGNRNDLTPTERHTAQTHLLHAKEAIYNIHTRW